VKGTLDPAHTYGRMEHRGTHFRVVSNIVHPNGTVTVQVDPWQHPVP
jgi:hypothetical protein